MTTHEMHAQECEIHAWAPKIHAQARAYHKCMLKIEHIQHEINRLKLRNLTHLIEQIILIIKVNQYNLIHTYQFLTLTTLTFN
jgi:hypothetical protein